MPSLLNTASFFPVHGSSKSREHDSTKKEVGLNRKAVFKLSTHTCSRDTAEHYSTRGRYGANSFLLLTARDATPFTRDSIHPHSPTTRTLSKHLQTLLGATTGRGEVCYWGWHGEARCNALHPTTQDRIHTHSLTPSAIRATAEEPKLKFL